MTGCGINGAELPIYATRIYKTDGVTDNFHLVMEPVRIKGGREF